jgi:hypothetical protein
MHHGRMGHERVWAASGALAVALFACGLVFGDLLGADNYPALDARAGEVRRYFLDNASEARALGFFHVLSGLALLCSPHISASRSPAWIGSSARSPRSAAPWPPPFS